MPDRRPAAPDVDGGRLRALDAFRGIAALCVVMYHVTLRYPDFMAGRGTAVLDVFGGWSVDAGRVPVLWFFMLSGFVITWTVDRSRTPMDFVVSRVSRIYPAYWASIGLAVVAVAVFPLPGVTHRPAQVLANLSMLQSLLLIPDVAGVYWSLAIEVVFYLYVLALFALGLWRWAAVAGCAWAWLGLCVAVLDRAGVATPWRVNQLLLLHAVPFLMAGTSLYRLWRRDRVAWSGGTLVVCIAAILVSERLADAASCLGGLLVIAVASGGHLEWLAVRPLLWLGSISYSLYLVHEYPSYIVIRALDGRGVPHAVSIGAAIVVSVGLAYGVTRVVERPAMRAIRGAWRRRGVAALR